MHTIASRLPGRWRAWFWIAGGSIAVAYLIAVVASVHSGHWSLIPRPRAVAGSVAFVIIGYVILLYHVLSRLEDSPLPDWQDDPWDVRRWVALWAGCVGVYVLLGVLVGLMEGEPIPGDPVGMAVDFGVFVAGVVVFMTGGAAVGKAVRMVWVWLAGRGVDG